MLLFVKAHGAQGWLVYKDWVDVVYCSAATYYVCNIAVEYVDNWKCFSHTS